MADEQDEKFKRLKAIRAGNRGVLTKYTKEAMELLNGEERSTFISERLNTVGRLLNEKIEKVRDLDSQILELCDVAEIVQEIEESEEVYSRACDVKAKITKFTNELIDKTSKDTGQITTTQDSETTFVPSSPQSTNLVQNTNTQITDTNSIQNTNTQITDTNSIQNSNAQIPVTSMQNSVRSKLPKLTLPKFKGDVTTYKSFWQIFESTVDKNAQLTSIDKFNYLVSLLEGQALRSIKGLAITEDNYQAALDILQERYGNSQQIISAHMDDLLKLQPCSGEKASQLRYIYDKVSVNVRALEALGVHSDQYGSLLIPVIMSKLSSDVRLQIARNTRKDVWARLFEKR
ncbi:uncharacterized protein LOC114531823 [Dendronephthya gigantea]|uniref:uncharacterized protein LOC114531823 n=1 Tax=Dendronephthya gigantea TaxID=151771 RepID=UPI00106BED64|nr:uncharacterized protein LOC114531823 [Dendronephthya gigantea]